MGDPWLSITLTLCHILHSVSHSPVLVYFINRCRSCTAGQSTLRTSYNMLHTLCDCRLQSLYEKSATQRALYVQAPVSECTNWCNAYHDQLQEPGLVC
jgi:hypothetical protein